MINFTICDPHVRDTGSANDPRRWLVVVWRTTTLAYCSTKEEAVAVREAINDMPRVLRGVGETVK